MCFEVFLEVLKPFEECFAVSPYIWYVTYRGNEPCCCLHVVVVYIISGGYYDSHTNRVYSYRVGYIPYRPILKQGLPTFLL